MRVDAESSSKNNQAFEDLGINIFEVYKWVTSSNFSYQLAMKSKISLAILAMVMLVVNGQIDCRNVPNAITNLDSRACICVPSYQWNKLQCALDCSNVTNSNGRAKSLTSCFCKSGYTWSNNSCSINCERFANTVSNLNSTSCVCKPGYTWSGQSCVLTVNCSADIHSIGTNAVDGTCVCSIGYQWSSIDLVCIASATSVPSVNCSQISDTNGNNGSRACYCQPGYSWDGLQCQINCSNVSNATSPAGPKTCRCQSGFVWQNRQCIRFVNCSAINNANGNNGISACFCVDGYQWTNGACNPVSAPVNCSAIPHTNGSNGTTACYCMAGYKWMNGSCHEMVNCSSIPNTAGQDNAGGCLCMAGYDWDGMVCQQNLSNNEGVNCSTFPFTTGPTGMGTCKCVRNYYWDQNIFACRPNCSQIPYANGSGMTFSYCQCSKGFFWNGGNCQRNCSAIAGAWVNTDVLNCSCLPSIYFYTWNGSACVGFDESNNSLISCIGMPGSTNTAHPNGSCICIEGFTWNEAFKACHINCSAIESSNGSISATTCGCDTNYFWNGTHCQPIINNFSCEGQANSPGTDDPNGGCICNAGFFWNSTAHGCQRNCSLLNDTVGAGKSLDECACAEGFFWQYVVCLRNCLLIEDANGTLVNIRNCVCYEGTTWNGSTCLLNCETIPFATSRDPSNSSACLCLAGYIWQDDQCQVNCSETPNSMVNPNNASECVCDTGFELVDDSCQINCSDVLNSASDGFNLSCECQQNFTWQLTYDYAPPACFPNCSSFPYTDPNVQTIQPECICIKGYSWDINKCVLNCYLIRFANGSNGTDGCLCQTNFTWNGSQCLPNCSNLSNSNRTNQTDATACVCNMWYVWEPKVGACVRACWNQTEVTYNSSNYSACECIEGYRWVDGYCELYCQDIPNFYTGNASINWPGFQGNETNTTQKRTCWCNRNYSWDGLYCSPNCSAFPHATNLLSGQRFSRDCNCTSAAPPSCNCTYPFSWNGSACIVNCVKVFNANGTIDALTCNCEQGYVWNATSYSCQLDCQQVEDSTRVPNGQRACYCEKGYTWTGYACELVCGVLPQTVVDDLEESETGTCECAVGYEWSSVAVECVAIASR